MTKKQLIDALAEYDDETHLFVSSDEEGNTIHRLATISPVLTDDRNAYDLLDTSYYDDAEEVRFYGEDPIDYAAVIVFWP